MQTDPGKGELRHDNALSARRQGRREFVSLLLADVL